MSAPTKNGGANGASPRFDEFLRRSPQGREFLEESARARERREMREAAAERHHESEVLRAEFPELVADVEAAVDARDRAIAEHQAKVSAARRAKNEAVGRIEQLRRQGEDVLRRTADPLVHDSGPVMRALEEARQHLRTHVVTDEWTLGLAADEKPKDRTKEGAWNAARRDVEASNEALERLAAFDFAIAELRDLQLRVEVDPAELREILDACPTRCGCGAPLGYGPPTFTLARAGLVENEPPTPTDVPPWLAALEGATS